MLIPEAQEVQDLWIEIDKTPEYLDWIRTESAKAGLPERQHFDEMTAEDAAVWKRLLLEWKDLADVS